MKHMTHALIGLVVGCGLATAAQAQNFDLTTEFNQNHLLAPGYEKLASDISEATNGEVTVTIHYGGSLGFRSNDHIEAVGSGAVPIADSFTSPLAGTEPIFGLSSMPFLVRNIEEAELLKDIAEPYYTEAFEKHNQVLLVTSVHPASGLWAKEEITSMEALDGLKLRTYDSMGEAAFRAAGAAPIQIPWNDVIPQLATGGIDAVLTSAEGATSVKMWEHLDHFIAINYAIPLQFMHMNRDAYEALSDEQRSALDKVASEVEDANWQRARDGRQDAYDLMRSNGMTIVEEPPQEFMAALGEAGQGPLENWKEATGETGEKILAEFYEKAGR